MAKGVREDSRRSLIKDDGQTLSQISAGAGNGRSAAPLLVSRHFLPLLVAFDSMPQLRLRENEKNRK